LPDCSRIPYDVAESQWFLQADIFMTSAFRIQTMPPVILRAKKSAAFPNFSDVHPKKLTVAGGISIIKLLYAG